MLCIGILTEKNTGIHVLHWLLLLNCCHTMGEYAHLQKSPFSSVSGSQQVCLQAVFCKVINNSINNNNIKLITFVFWSAIFCHLQLESVCKTVGKFIN